MPERTPPHATIARLITEVGKALSGKPDVIRLAVTTLLADGHLLIEDVPGVGKTTLARALAAVLGLRFSRVQFTSDLMPSDVLGGNIYDPATGDFRFREGPIFTQLLLADEINRTTPKTQSALLEAMAERQVSIEGETRSLERPFFVIATQNPDDFYGTYPLPESQLDRFLMRLSIGYPAPEIEREVIRQRRREEPVESLTASLTPAALEGAQRAVDEVRVEDPVIDYLHQVIVATREAPSLRLGVSTRGAIALERAVRAHALVDGRMHALPDDVQALAVPVLAHRVRTVSEVQDRESAEAAVRGILQTLPVPV